MKAVSAHEAAMYYCNLILNNEVEQWNGSSMEVWKQKRTSWPINCRRRLKTWRLFMAIGCR